MVVQESGRKRPQKVENQDKKCCVNQIMELYVDLCVYFHEPLVNYCLQVPGLPQLCDENSG